MPLPLPFSSVAHVKFDGYTRNVYLNKNTYADIIACEYPLNNWFPSFHLYSHGSCQGARSWMQTLWPLSTTTYNSPRCSIPTNTSWTISLTARAHIHTSRISKSSWTSERHRCWKFHEWTNTQVNITTKRKFKIFSYVITHIIWIKEYQSKSFVFFYYYL